MSEAPERIWANVAVWGNGEPLAGEWNSRDVGRDDDTLYIRADVADAEIADLRAKLAEARAENDRWRNMLGPADDFASDAFSALLTAGVIGEVATTDAPGEVQDYSAVFANIMAGIHNAIIRIKDDTP